MSERRFSSISFSTLRFQNSCSSFWWACPLREPPLSGGLASIERPSSAACFCVIRNISDYLVCRRTLPSAPGGSSVRTKLLSRPSCTNLSALRPRSLRLSFPCTIILRKCVPGTRWPGENAPSITSAKLFAATSDRREFLSSRDLRKLDASLETSPFDGLARSSLNCIVRRKSSSPPTKCSPFVLT